MNKLILIFIIMIVASHEPKLMAKSNKTDVQSISFEYQNELNEIRNNLNEADRDLKEANLIVNDKKKFKRLKRKLK